MRKSTVMFKHTTFEEGIVSSPPQQDTIAFCGNHAECNNLTTEPCAMRRVRRHKVLLENAVQFGLQHFDPSPHRGAPRNSADHGRSETVILSETAIKPNPELQL